MLVTALVPALIDTICSLAQLIAEAHAARMQIEGVAPPPIDSGACGRLPRTVMQAAQFLLELVRGDRRTHIQFERRGVDARRHGPVASLELGGHDAVQVHDPGADRGREYQQGQDDRHAPAQQLGTSRAPAQ